MEKVDASHALRVLVVDDNKDAADSLALLLRLAGHKVQVAYSGPSALLAAMECVPDVMLLDIALPKMDGYQVAQYLRARPATKEVFIIAVTGYGQASDRAASRAAGCDAHFLKPVDIDQLLGLLSGDVTMLLEKHLQDSPSTEAANVQ